MFSKSLIPLSIYFLLLLALELCKLLGLVQAWLANTLAQRLLDNQVVLFALLALLASAQLLRVLSNQRFATSFAMALSITLVIAGIASAVLFDPTLCLLLCLGAAPVWRAAKGGPK